jgi:glucokinase
MAAYRGEAPNILKLAGTDLAQIRSGVLADAIKAGDKVVEDIVNAAAKHLGTAIAGVVNLLAPDVVVLGGGLIEALETLIVDQVRRTVRRRAMTSFADAVSIVPAKLGDFAGAMGAAALALEAAGEAG